MIVCPSAKGFRRACCIIALLITAMIGAARWRAEARFDGSTSSVVTVSAASFEGSAVAPEAIVAGFGSGFATQTIAGNDTDSTKPGVQLPLELGGTSVEVNGRRAELLFVSPGQINYIIPTGTESGPADISIRRNQTLTAIGSVQIASVSPGVFTANSDGNGWAAAQVLRVKSDFSVSYEQVVQYDQVAGRYVASPINLGPETDRVFLVVFATGMRRALDPNGDGNLSESVRVLLGGDQLTPFYAGIQADYVGLDQINVELPRTLIGRGELSFSVAVSGFAPSNLAQIMISGPPGPTPPQVSSFGAGAALAGQTLLINGSGFSTTPSDNIVRIGGIEAQVMTSTTTQLTVIVPFGAASGAVRVRTPVGEGASSSQLQVRTSISGFVENTAREPMGGVRVRLAESTITAETSAEGTFVLADVPLGSHLVDIEGGSVQTTPPYPKVTLKITAVANQDNQFVGPISLQQSTGGSGNVGNPGGFGEEFAGGHGSNSVSIVSGNSLAKRLAASWQTQPTTPTPIQIGDFSLVIPASLDATFPNGAKEGKIFLTQLDQSRVPVDLPRGIFSSSIAQITPFNIQFNPGVKLVFPNSDRLPAGATAKLFRYDQSAGQFVEDPLGATVSADGRRIETAANAIKQSSYYFVARPTQTTVISGRVLDADRRPVRRAVVSVRGQEIFTDGNGGFVLRYVPIFGEEVLTLDASFQRPSGRVERTRSLPSGISPNFPAKIQDILLPPSNENRPPVVFGPLRATVSENELASLSLNISDPDGNPIPRVTLTGPDFATLISPTVAGSPLYEIRLAPDFRDSGIYPLIIDAFDVFGASTRRIIQLTVNNINRLPVASDQSVTLDEDKSLEISLVVNDPDDDLLSFYLINSPEHGTVNGSGSVITYTPTRDYFGTDRFTYKVSDGTSDSNIATVSITIRSANDAPRLTVPEVSSVREGERLSFTVIANDPDPGQNLTFSSENLPLGATFTPVSATNAVFSWQPSFRQAGTYNFNLVVMDNGTPPASLTRALRLVVYDTRRDLTTEPAELTIFGRTNGEALGASVAVGDLDDDGIGDLVVGAPYDGNNGGIGQVRVFFGRERRAGNVDLADQSADVTISGETNGDRFGAALAIGDFNGDGKADLAIGAPRADDLNRTDAGAVYVIFGPLHSGSFEAMAIIRWLAVGAHAGDQFGAALAAGDINGDQKVDLVIGAPNFGTIIQNKPVPAAGAVYGFFGGPLFKDAQDLALTSANLTLTGIIPDSRLGSALAIGDFNGDGRGDLVAGAPLADLAKKDQGLVYFFTGGAELKGAKAATEAAKFELPGQDTGDNFGAALGFGDFNGDGRLDLIVGAPGGAGPNNLRLLAGEALVFLGTNSLDARPPNTTIYGSSSNPGSLGASLAIGDFTGDGIADLALGAPTLEALDGQPPSTGAVYLIFGANRTPSVTIDLATRAADLTIIGASAGDQIGLGGLLIGDLDFDLNRIGELIIGVPRGASRNDGRPKAGEVHVLRGIGRQ
jgi:uncharacterized protein (TIGR03437 family)